MECEPATGQCSTAPVANGTSCDDGKACTAADVCQAGTCAGSVPALVLSGDVNAIIPDGPMDCTPRPEDPLISVSFEVTAPGDFGSGSVELDMQHYYISELEILLRHEPTGETQSLFSRPNTPGVHIDGKYTFADDGMRYPMDIEYQDLDPGRYAPVESFVEAFEGVRLAGTWTLTISDSCHNDQGVLRSVTLRLNAAPCP